MIFFYVYLLLVTILSLIFKKKGIFLNYSGDVHQSFSNKKNVPLAGGFFILIPLIFFLNDLFLNCFIASNVFFSSILFIVYWKDAAKSYFNWTLFEIFFDSLSTAVFRPANDKLHPALFIIGSGRLNFLILSTSLIISPFLSFPFSPFYWCSKSIILMEYDKIKNII